MNQLDVSVKYEFPKGFHPDILKGVAALIEKNVLDFNLAQKMLLIRDQDLSTDVQHALTKLVTDIRQFNFQNHALVDSPLPYVTNSKEVVAKLRRELHDSVYRLAGIFRDFDVTVKLQMFNLTKFSNYTNDVNVQHLSANDEAVPSPESMKAKLAIRNMQEIQRFFDSIEKSSTMHDLFEATTLLETIKPTVSFGGLVYEMDNSVFEHLPAVAF